MSGTQIVLIIIVVLAYSLLRVWLKAEKAAPPPDEAAGEMLDKIEVLEERIRVLERIVTDHDIDLKKEIDNL
jgi:hypothetical protein